MCPCTENGDILQHCDMTLSDVPWSVSHSELVKEPCVDGSVRDLLDSVCPSGKVRNHSHCLVMQNQVLMRVPQGFCG